MDVELYRAPIMQVGLIMLEFWGGVAIASWSGVYSFSTRVLLPEQGKDLRCS